MPSTIVSDPGQEQDRLSRGRLRRVLDGALFVPRGMWLFLRRPRLWLLGFTPVGVATGFVLLAAVLLAFLVPVVTGWVTPFADSWPLWLRGTVRISIGVSIFAGFVLAVVMLFAEVTNVIGQPFFEILSDHIERECGRAPAGAGASWWSTLPLATLESAITILLWLLCLAPLLVASLLPVVGQTVVPVLAALVSGYFLSLEIVQIPLERRGMRLRERLSYHWAAANFAEVLGFGVAAFLIFLVPLMNVVAMPGAIVGATLLVRRLTGEDPCHVSRRRQGFQIPFRPLAIFAAGIVVTFIFWDTWLTWPVQLLVVFVHECGHALAAVLTGGEVRSLEIHGNLSGQARTYGGIPFLILQAGYLASALFGAVLMVAATRPRSARNTLLILAVLLAGCGVAFSGTPFSVTLLFALLVATLFAWAARAAPEYAVRWGLVYVATVSALYALIDIRQDVLRWDGGHGVSDATILATRTGVPALVWGIGWALVALAMMAAALRRILR